ncbi:hypothetical protein LLG90_27235, partial [Aromatoleum toluclasticum]|uniref:hypothetical protein n=1 Tax=Aromatoleum toluclasticum TaxID=92003 RepID=UPI001D1831E7
AGWCTGSATGAGAAGTGADAEGAADLAGVAGADWAPAFAGAGRGTAAGRGAAGGRLRDAPSPAFGRGAAERRRLVGAERVQAQQRHRETGVVVGRER